MYIAINFGYSPICILGSPITWNTGKYCIAGNFGDVFNLANSV